MGLIGAETYKLFPAQSHEARKADKHHFEITGIIKRSQVDRIASPPGCRKDERDDHPYRTRSAAEKRTWPLRWIFEKQVVSGLAGEHHHVPGRHGLR